MDWSFHVGFDCHPLGHRQAESTYFHYLAIQHEQFNIDKVIIKPLICSGWRQIVFEIEYSFSKYSLISYRQVSS